jgi:hypothetical protein
VMEEIFDIDKRGFHNMRAAAIARSWSKPADLKVKLEIYLTIANRQARLLHANACTDAQMHVVDALRLMRSGGRVKGIFCFAAPQIPLSALNAFLFCYSPIRK